MYYSLQDIEFKINEKIVQGELNEALSLIIKFVESIINDRRATHRVFGSKVMDSLCQKIGAKTLTESIHLVEKKMELESDLIIYIATELSITGGHTAVLEDLIKFQPKKRHLILITDIFGSGESESIKNRFYPYLINLKWAPNGTYLDKLNWLQQQLITCAPDQVFLFNHWQDAVAISAVQPTLDNQLIFYHHADHHCCLGLYLSYAQHVDPHSYGYYNCLNNLGVKNTVYIPLVAEDLNNRPHDIAFLAEGTLRTCSSGGGHKFEQPYAYVYAEEISKLLHITKGYHIHIGYLSTHSLDTIKLGLEARKIDQDRFIYIPWVKSVWQTIHDQRVDIYISSFPVGGGRASIEVMGSGTPIIGHQNYQVSALSCAEIIYPEAFFWNTPDDLYNYLSSLTKDALIEQAAFSRRHYELNHTPKIFQQCLEGLRSKNDVIYPQPLKAYFREELRSFLDEIAPYELELQQTQIELQQTQIELQQTQIKLQQTQIKLQQTQVELQQTQIESENTITAMESSKFWKLRQVWINLKKVTQKKNNNLES